MPRKKADQTAETAGDQKPRLRVTQPGPMPVRADAPSVVASVDAAAASPTSDTTQDPQNANDHAERPKVRLAYLSDLLVKHEIPAEQTMDFIALMKKANFHEDVEKRIDIAMVEKTRFYVEVDPKKVLAKDLKMMQRGIRQYIIMVDERFERFVQDAKRALSTNAPANALTIESLQEGRNTLDDLLKEFEHTRQFHLSQAKTDRKGKPKPQKLQVEIEKV